MPDNDKEGTFLLSDARMCPAEYAVPPPTGAAHWSVEAGQKKSGRLIPDDKGRRLPSNINIGGFQRIFFDKRTPRLYRIPHQRGKQLIGRDGVLYRDAQHTAAVRVHGRFP